jgi:hypothetical protein
MTIPSKLAVAIAKKHKLTPSDALALRGLAETEDEAEEIAATLSPAATAEDTEPDYGRLADSIRGVQS